MFADITVKFKLRGIESLLIPNGANVVANSVDPGQTAPRRPLN